MGAHQFLGGGALDPAQGTFPQLLGVQLQNGDVQLAFGSEVVIEHRGHHARELGDVLHLGLGEPVLGEGFDGRVENACAPLRRRDPGPCHTEL